MRQPNSTGGCVALQSGAQEALAFPACTALMHCGPKVLEAFREVLANACMAAASLQLRM